MQLESLTQFQLLALIFGVTAFAGLASVLRSKRSLSIRTLVSVLLNSGLSGLACGLVGREYLTSNVQLLLGLLLLLSLGGTPILDFVLSVIQNGGIDISIAPRGGWKRKKVKEDADD